MIFAISCNKSIMEPEQTLQLQPQTNGLKAGIIGTIFVSPTGSNSNAGTELKPFQTLAYAASVAKAGDVVVFENGIYTGTPGNFLAVLPQSGTSSAYITFIARNKGGAILDGKNNSAIAAFSISGSYINISGFEIKGMLGVGIEARNGASHLNFSDLNIHDIGRGAFQNDDGRTAFTLGNGSYMIIERCLIHTIGAYAPGENGCTYSAGWTGYQTLDHGIYIAGTNYLTIKNNVFYDCKSGFAIQFYCGSGYPSSNVQIINNTFENGNPWQNAGHIILWNSVSNSLIANNIFKDQYSYAINIYQGSYSYSNVTITKNITSGGNGITITGSASGVTTTGNYDSKDPLFTNEAAHDYSLQSNSPAAITGYNTSLTTDYLNNARTTIDIGAFATNSTAPTPTLTPTPTPKVYYNTQTSSTATKNSCGTGYTGSTLTYTVSANKYSSTISQADADTKAAADITSNTQTYANTNGTCTVIPSTTYSNIQMSATTAKNSCGSGYIGSNVTYTVSAGKYISTVSQADADAKASSDLSANKQSYANMNGTCTLIKRWRH